jgi:hypothetical protein
MDYFDTLAVRFCSPSANNELNELLLALTVIITSANDTIAIPNRRSTFPIKIYTFKGRRRHYCNTNIRDRQQFYQ